MNVLEQNKETDCITVYQGMLEASMKSRDNALSLQYTMKDLFEHQEAEYWRDFAMQHHELVCHWHRKL